MIVQMVASCISTKYWTMNLVNLLSHKYNLSKYAVYFCAKFDTMKFKIEYLLILVLMGFMVACKSDKKDELTAVTDSTSLTTKPKKELTDKERVYVKAKRKRDSLKIMKKLQARGGEVKPEEVTKILDSKPVKKTVRSKVEGIPNACDFLQEEDVAEIFKMDVSLIDKIDGTRRKTTNTYSRSCFWKWEDGGILIEVKVNPIPEDINDWCSRYVASKRQNGEMSPNGVFKYKEFDGPGTESVYNHDLGRYVVRKGEEYVVCLYFNGNMKEQKQLEFANAILNRVFSQI